ncbi:site-specific DNA-methyltransferase [Streptomyces sp. NBC_01723]|uniref:DNA-methyltransferase n=1 Tax=Streptomyces sp. NBC_01723 TaxID=2975921 RepID=UPI002E32A8DC|nr:site-specific DNA-methyltransferase [Streptomyces sp. NBC_01723]
MTKPYWEDTDAGLALYHGDMRELLPQLELQADLILADPPYAETSLKWDRWPDGWLTTAAKHARSMWCFGSQRMFFDRLHEFRAEDWHLSQDVVGKDPDGQPVFGDVHFIWEKTVGSSAVADRFRRVHEHALHWYRGPWRDVHHEAQRERRHGRNQSTRRSGYKGPHLGTYNARSWADDGTRLLTSMIQTSGMRGKAIHPTQKPLKIAEPLIRYGCPPGGLVLDVFSGSGVGLEAARQSGRRCIAIEAREEYCERIARRLSEMPLFIAEPVPAAGARQDEEV